MQNLDMTPILTWAWRVTPVLLGAACGFLFYRFVGCKTGHWPDRFPPDREFPDRMTRDQALARLDF